MLSNIKLLCNNTKILDNFSNMYKINNDISINPSIINKYSKKNYVSSTEVGSILLILMKLLLTLINHYGNNKENHETTTKLSEIYNEIRILYNKNTNKVIKQIKTNNISQYNTYNKKNIDNITDSIK